MQQTKPILSISLLCSGRKKTTRKCLDSLRRIMDEISSELIIVDTGCDDDTHDVLLEYADKVIPFVWCRDFSKARNMGLKAAKGEWFLYIDDDEWFEDIVELVDFFKSGDYQNYAMANYIQRNYADYEEKHYSDSWVSRLAKITKELQFESSIHEYLAPICGECKLIHSYVKHFGYIFDSPEEKYRHSQRNISLLLEMIRKERGSSRWWMQLAQEYKAIGENAKLYDTCTEALKYFSNWNNWGVNKERGAFYVGRMLADFSLFRYEDAVADYEKAIQDKRNTDICRASLLLNGTYAFFLTERYDKCRECGTRYLQFYEAWHEDEQKIVNEAAFFVRDAFSRENIEKTYSYLILAGLRQKQEAELHLYFPHLSLQPDLEYMYFYPPLVPELLEYWSEADYDKRFSDYADTLMHCKLLVGAVVQELRKIEKDNARREQYDRLVRIFAQTDAEHFYIIYMKILYAGKNGDRATLKEHFRYLFAHVIDIFQLPDYIWDIAMGSPEMVHELFLEIPFEQWKNGIDVYIKCADAQSVEKRMEIMRRPQFQSDIRYDYFLVRAKEALLVYGRYREDHMRQKELLEDFSESAIAFYRLFFTERAFQGEMEFLPENCRAAVYIRDALTCHERDLDKALACYDQAISVFPSFEGVLKEYCKTLRDLATVAETFFKCDGEEHAEMAELARGVKKQIRVLLECGLMEEAAEALRQLKTLVMEDDEIRELEKQMYIIAYPSPGSLGKITTYDF